MLYVLYKLFSTFLFTCGNLSFINLVVKKKGTGEGGLNNFLPLKMGALLEKRGLFERGFNRGFTVSYDLLYCTCLCRSVDDMEAKTFSSNDPVPETKIPLF